MKFKKMIKLIPTPRELIEEYELKEKFFSETASGYKSKVALLASQVSTREMAKRESVVLKLLQLAGYKSIVSLERDIKSSETWKNWGKRFQGNYRIFQSFNSDKILKTNELLDGKNIERIEGLLPTDLIRESLSLNDLLGFKY